VCTSLGEKGAEAVVVVSGLALFGEVAVRLDSVLEAVELLRLARCAAAAGGELWWTASERREVVDVWPEVDGAAAIAARVRRRRERRVRSVPPSTSWRSGNRPGQLYLIAGRVSHCLVCKKGSITTAGSSGQRATRVGEAAGGGAAVSGSRAVAPPPRLGNEGQAGVFSGATYRSD